MTWRAASTASADCKSQPGGQLPRTIWGLDPQQLHTRYWAAHGVQVVRQGEPSEIVKHAELFLLTDSGSLALFSLAPLMDALNWIKPQVLFVRLHDAHERPYRENVVTDEAERFVRFQRIYDASSHLARVALTPDREIAQLWQSCPRPADWVASAAPIHSPPRPCDANVERRRVCGQPRSRSRVFPARSSAALEAARQHRAPRNNRGDEVWKDPKTKIDPTAKVHRPGLGRGGPSVSRGRLSSGRP